MAFTAGVSPGVAISMHHKVIPTNNISLWWLQGWGWTVVTLGARWPLLCHPFVLYIGKTWPSHGPNMAHFKSDVISVKNFKKFKNEFRVKFGARVKIKLQIVFKTINFIYPENLCLSGLFLSKIE